jgi:hypothetical protein
MTTPVFSSTDGTMQFVVQPQGQQQQQQQQVRGLAGNCWHRGGVGCCDAWG